MRVPERYTFERFMSPKDDVRIFHQFLAGGVELHCHEFYELHVVLAGEAVHLLNGMQFILKPGSAFLLTPADFHEMKIRQPLESYNIIFSDSVLSKEVYSYVFDLNRKFTIEFDEQSLAYTRLQCERLCAESSTGATGAHLVMRNILELLLIEIARSNRVTEYSFLAGGSEHSIIWKALIFMHHHFREDLTLREVALQIPLSPNYFSERFRSLTGITFQKYLQDLRLSFAANLLAASHVPVTEVCSASGFGSLPHFERTFLLKFKQSPRAYRLSVHER